jgi:cation diffusion facilitator CzcD-associated flavoprotein CzcO
MGTRLLKDLTGDGYLEAQVQLNVKTVFSGINKVTPEGIVTADGTKHKMDILVCATGFYSRFQARFQSYRRC